MENNFYFFLTHKTVMKPFSEMIFRIRYTEIVVWVIATVLEWKKESSNSFRI